MKLGLANFFRQVGVSPGVLSDCNIAFPRFGGQIPFFFALNARGIAAVTNAMTNLGMIIPFMVPSVNPTLLQPTLSTLGTGTLTLPQQVLISSVVEKKEETRKKAEQRIVQLFSYNSEPIRHITTAILGNGEINCPSFRSRVMGILDALPTLSYKGCAFGGFLISSLFLGNYTSSHALMRCKNLLKSKVFVSMI